MKTKKIQRPFSVEEWRNGAKVETRDGRPVRILCTDYKERDYPVVGIVRLGETEESINTFTLDGRFNIHKEEDRDLVIVEEIEEPERWAEDEDVMEEGWYTDEQSEIRRDDKVFVNDDYNYKFFATERQAKSALAMARISQLMAHDERYGGVVTDEEWEKPGVDKYGVVRCKNAIKNEWFNMRYCFLAFHTPEQRDLFLSENEQLVKDYLMID